MSFLYRYEWWWTFTFSMNEAKLDEGEENDTANSGSDRWVAVNAKQKFQVAVFSAIGI